MATTKTTDTLKKLISSILLGAALLFRHVYTTENKQTITTTRVIWDDYNQ